MRKVLIAEDEAQLQEVIRITLEDMGLELSEARDPDTLKQLIVDSKPDIVLLDEHLGGRDTNELIAAVRRSSSTVSLVLLRQDHTPLEHPLEGEVCKPFSPSSLLAALYKSFNRT